MKIISIDPGYERLGIAVLENKKNKEVLVFSECFQTPKSDLNPERIKKIGQRFEKLLKEYKPEVLAIENLFFNKNKKTALFVSEIKGLLIYLSMKNGLKVFEYTPPQIKVAVTSYGKSDKKQVIDMVQKLIKIDKKIKYDDEFDAIAVGLTCLASERF